MKVSLSSTDIATLERYQRNVSDRRSYVKVTCILMLGKGLSPKAVSEYLGIDGSTVYRYADSYHEDGMEAYLRTDYKGYFTDNARYYRNKKLMEWLETTKIKPVFLPPYSPNLNLIERLWKFMRKKVINTCFYRTKDKFRMAILEFFENIDQYKLELETLMTLNFRLVKSQSNAF
jgi:transposase